MTPQKKDRLYSTKQKTAPFRFNKAVTQVFDDMLVRSVPCYKQVQEQILSLMTQLAPSSKKIYDLGCSTGSLMFFLAQNLNNSKVHYTGVDNSKDMITKAKENLKTKNLKGRFTFLCKDLCECSCKDADVITINYVLQFLAPDKRLEFLRQLSQNIKKGTLVIISDKTLSPSKKIASSFINIHEVFKLKNHYTKLEIAQKRKSLEKVLIPLSLADNVNLLQSAGFKEVEPFFTWFNFASFVAIK